MRRDDDDDPFDEFFREIERMMDEMMGSEGDVHIDRNGPTEGADLHVDVHETDDEIRVVADIPGAEKDAIDLKCDGTVLTIDAGTATKEYHERLTLPSRVDEHSASATYNNGILEVTFDREEDSADIEL
ncbi:Hsp20/alpha crystallin family protein [Haloarcula litorea]|uniref:Hsp20/alpha crystallin family protein n=1 Tax=Haloarcula litorea TaxID=3032579 RepID=UPI0023E8175D|nr:Hsp20/alpha crystallin family protein [Halomicroarcula sp. GDY20]